MKKSPNKKTIARKTVVRKNPVSKKSVAAAAPDYDSVLSGVVELLQEARRASARTVNAIMTATYWEVGRRIVEGEQGGKVRADYGEQLLERLSSELTSRFGRGFGLIQLRVMRQFYVIYPLEQIRQSLIDESVPQTESRCSTTGALTMSETVSMKLAYSFHETFVFRDLCFHFFSALFVSGSRLTLVYSPACFPRFSRLDCVS